MPVITVEGSAMSREVKEKLAAELTRVASEVTDIRSEAFIVILKENPLENIASGGVLLDERLKAH